MSATRSLLNTAHPKATVRGQRNNAGGPTHVIDDWARLTRFLILGTEGGTYYVNERDHTMQNVASLKNCLDLDADRTVATIVEVSDSGRAPKNDYAIYALAVAACHPKAKRIALANLNKVCRTGTHLFQFVSFVDAMRGWGPALRRAVANWYLTKPADQLAYQVLKYQQREGWSHRDILRKVHPSTIDPVKNGIFGYITGKDVDTRNLPAIVGSHAAFNDMARYLPGEDCGFAIAAAIEAFNLPREIVPTQYLTHHDVALALAQTMPYTALMRNLGNLSKAGITNEIDVTGRLTDESYIKKSRVHPISILTALRTYGQGHGFRGSNSWTVDRDITNALDDAFYKAFQNVEPTGKRFMVGVDVSASMSWQPSNGILTGWEIAAALAMTLVRTEPMVRVYGFSSSLTPMDVWPTDKLEQVIRKASNMGHGGTDAALIIDTATRNRTEVDVFVVITDNETWVRGRKPSDALREYRNVMGIDAKMIVLATDSTSFSIADPNDPGMLDIAGFDSSVPEVIREFALGNI